MQQLQSRKKGCSGETGLALRVPRPDKLGGVSLLKQARDDMASTCCIAGDGIEEVVFKSGLLSSVGLLRLGFSFLQNYIQIENTLHVGLGICSGLPVNTNAAIGFLKGYES